MTRRGKIALTVLVVGSLLGLVAATNAWFVAVSNTPPGKISSALVRYLPEAGPRSFTSLLTYGNLISGGGVDPDGTPLVLPGNSLLASASASDGKRLVRTSIARAFEEKETVDTVIHREVRTLGGVEITRKQRDLMQADPPLDRWYEGDSTTPLASPPTINATQYDVVTTTSGGEGVPGTGPDNLPTITTTTVVTTTYTPRVVGISAYRHEVTTTKIVTEEPETFSPNELAGKWVEATPVLTATETVLFVQLAPLKQPTRSFLMIEHVGTGPTTIPLTLGNLSTVASNVRVGLNGRLTSADGASVTNLTLSGPDADGICYLGTAIEGKSVELISFRPYQAAAVTTAGAERAAYQWTPVLEKEGSDVEPRWFLWDLTVDGSLNVPALPQPDTGTESTVTAAQEPVPYIVTDALRIISKRPTINTALTDAEFELLFNQLYCEKVPTITLHVSYYARQNEYMGWNEFYSQDIDMSLYN